MKVLGVSTALTVSGDRDQRIAQIAALQRGRVARRQLVAIEVDGFRFHNTRRAFEKDRRRDQALSGAGVRTMRVTWRQIEDEALAVVARMAEGMAWAARRPRLTEEASSPSRTRAAPG